MEIINQEPQQSSFVPLPEHQSQTPQSFYSGPPVLYHRSPNARLVVTRADAESSPVLSKLIDVDQVQEPAAENREESLVLDGVNIWVTSEKFILFRSTNSSGLSIPYPSISLHAIQRLQDPSGHDEVQGLYMQIVTSDGFDDHDPDGTRDFTLIPAPSNVSSGAASAQDGPATTQPSDPPIQALFSAVSACANLHPDPVSPSSSAAADIEGGDDAAIAYESLDGLPPPMPGSGGWITAENMHEFFDDEGNWRGGGLGPGAGIVREREREEEEPHTNGDGEVTDRTDEETKWRRTE